MHFTVISSLLNPFLSLQGWMFGELREPQRHSLLAQLLAQLTAHSMPFKKAPFSWIQEPCFSGNHMFLGASAYIWVCVYVCGKGSTRCHEWRRGTDSPKAPALRFRHPQQVQPEPSETKAICTTETLPKGNKWVRISLIVDLEFWMACIPDILLLRNLRYCAFCCAKFR